MFHSLNYLIFLDTTATAEENIQTNIKDAISDTSPDMTGDEHILVKTKNATGTEKGMVNLKMYKLTICIFKSSMHKTLTNP